MDIKEKAKAWKENKDIISSLISNSCIACFSELISLGENPCLKVVKSEGRFEVDIFILKDSISEVSLSTFYNITKLIDCSFEIVNLDSSISVVFYKFKNGGYVDSLIGENNGTQEAIETEGCC